MIKKSEKPKFEVAVCVQKSVLKIQCFQKQRYEILHAKTTRDRKTRGSLSRDSMKNVNKKIPKNLMSCLSACRHINIPKLFMTHFLLNAENIITVILRSESW